MLNPKMMDRTGALLLALSACAASSPEPANLVDNDGDGVAPDNGDCDDNDPSVYFGAPETSGDGIDSNCDNLDRQTLSASTAAVVFSPEPSGELWYAGTALGLHDVTGDGVLDVLVGAPGQSSPYGHSRVFVGTGQADLARIFDAPLRLGEPDARAATSSLAGRFDGGLDTDGDGVTDLLISGWDSGALFLVTEPVFDGWRVGDATASTLRPDGSGWGASAVLWPDDDGDDKAEIVASQAIWEDGIATGTISLFNAPHQGVLDANSGTTVLGGVLPEGLLPPYQLSRVPDMTGDGRPELFYRGGWVAPRKKGDVSRSHPITLIDLASEALTSWRFDTPRASADLRAYGGGDLTGDGRNDLVIADVGYRQANSVDVTGAVFIADHLPEVDATGDVEDGVVIRGVTDGDTMGSFALVYDVNQDGQVDLIVSARALPLQTQGPPGRVHVFFGPITEDKTAEQADIVITSDQFNTNFGATLAVGDVNDDGVPDLAVGAPWGGDAAQPQGRVYVFDGATLWTP